MNDKCKKQCRLLFCDFVSSACLLSDAEVVSLRPDLIKPTREEYLSRYDETRRNERTAIAIKRFTTNPDGVFARRRMRQLTRRQEVMAAVKESRNEKAKAQKVTV